MYSGSPQGRPRYTGLIFLDVLCLWCGLSLVLWVRDGLGAGPCPGPVRREVLALLTIIDLLSLELFDPYSGLHRVGPSRQSRAVLLHGLLVWIGTEACLPLVRADGADLYITHSTILVTVASHLALSLAAALLYKRSRWGGRRHERSLLVISTSGEVRGAIEDLRQDAGGPIRIMGAVVTDRDMTGTEIDGVRVIADRGGMVRAVCREWVDEAYVRLPPGGDIEEISQSMREMGITVHADISPHRGPNVQIEQIGGGAALTVSRKLVPAWQLAIKRCVDILGGLVGSAIALVIMALVAVPLKRQSPGPVLYRAERIGRDGRRFMMLKLRTMVVGAEERKKELADRNRIGGGLMFKLDWDPRIIGNVELPDGTRKTGIGDFLRTWSLDEFPQFFNVLKGDMSLVGTRPPTPDEWERYSPHHRARLAVTPGITGLWQVSGRSKIMDFEEVVRLDLEYIDGWDLWSDIKILLKTVAVVLTQQGAM